MTRRPTALVVQHAATNGPGRWAGWLAEGGLDLRVVRAYAGEPLPRRLEHAALLVLGGAYLPDDDERAPWLAPTRGLVREALGAEIPMFGICLGGQMLARVAGGAVRADHGEPEFGSTRLTLRAEAADDPLFRRLPAHPPAIENHVDAIVRLPDGARWLAESARCPYQAFRVGAAAWGVQFHPESSPERIAQWSAARLEPYGVDRHELCRRAVADKAALTETWREVALRFAAFVARREKAKDEGGDKEKAEEREKEGGEERRRSGHR